MKFAYFKGERREAERGLIGFCQGCEQPMIPVCGAKRAWHWRHKVDCECDHWWENETEWHRGWKNHFPKECQEVRHKDESTNEWHIADVKTEEGHVLEFQHSFLKPEERQARNDFYGEKLVWVVDGLARKNDWLKVEPILKTARQIYPDLNLFRLSSVTENSPLKEWSDCKVPVFFDFGEDKLLICLLPKSSKGNFYIVTFSREGFIALHNGESLNGKSFSDLMIFLQMRLFAFENPELMAAIEKLNSRDQELAQQETIKRPTIQRQTVPSISQRELNYLMRPQRPAPRRRRRF